MKQDFIQFVTKDSVMTLGGKNKLEVMDHLISRAADLTKLNRDTIFRLIWKREQMMTTGVGGMLALPHIRINDILHPYVLIGVCENPITDYQGLDDQPVRVIVFTIAPDENQEAYYTNADDKFTVFGLPLTSAPEIEFVSIIFEAMSAESYKTVFPAYYDQALKGKYSSDATTAEMVELIMAGRAFDFSFQVGESCFQRLPDLIRDHLVNNNPNLASAYKKLEKALAKSMDKILGKAYDLE